MTLIAVPIFVDAPADVTAALERAARAVQQGARLIEWRIDLLAEDPDGPDAAAALVERSPAPCIVTCRPVWEGGRYGDDEPARIQLLLALALRSPPPRYVDLERTGFERSEEIRRRIRETMLEPDASRRADVGLILSSHDFQTRPADLLQRVEAMTREPACAVVKIAWRARSLRDNLEAFDVLAERRKPTIALCMGEFGLMSRVLAPKFGGLLTFATDGEGMESAPGQPTLRTLRARYRFDAIGRETRVYGVIGWPVTHSRGPHVHNAGFDAVGHDGVYLPLPVPPEYEHFKATVGSFVDHPRLGFRGASVTAPHKTHLVRLVEERGGRVDARAAALGAANTLVVGSTGAIGCENTDEPAAVAALVETLGGEPDALRGRRVAVLGAGGVARAVVAGLASAGAYVTVFNRSRPRAEKLAEAIAASARQDARGRLDVGEPAALGRGCFEVFVNCTPVGMQDGPDPEGSPLPEDARLDDGVTVFDTVYAPARTPLIREAEARGARVVTGVDMFLKQAALQFERWTGKKAPRDVFGEAMSE